MDSPSPTPDHPYFAPARQGANQVWRYLLVIALVVSLYFFVGIVALLGLMLAAGTTDLSALPQAPLLAASMLPFPVALAVILLGVKFLHRRPVQTLISPARRPNWRRLFLAGGLWLLLSAAGDLVFALFVTPGNYAWSFQAGPWLVFAVVALLFVPLQSSTEEFLFRGYLMQGLGLLPRRPWIPLVVTSLLFASLHLANPEVAEYGFWVMTASYLAMGVLLGWLALRWVGLEAAVGVHVANNLYASLIVAFPSSAIAAPALWTIRQLNAPLSLAALLASGVVLLLLMEWLDPPAGAGG